MRPEEIMIAFALASAITLLALAVRAYRREIARGLWALADRAQGLAEWALQLRPRQMLAALLGLALLWTFLDGRMYRDGYFFLLLAAAFAVGFTVLWVREFLILMALRDDDLPGRFDKPIWAFMLIALPPIGLFLFRSHRLAHAPEPELEPGGKPHVSPVARELA